MAIWVMEGAVEHKDGAVWIDSVTETAFGPLFSDPDEALDFEAYYRKTYGVDPRKESSEVLSNRLSRWRESRKDVE